MLEMAVHFLKHFKTIGANQFWYSLCKQYTTEELIDLEKQKQKQKQNSGLFHHIHFKTSWYSLTQFGMLLKMESI